jgi:hypothetical protein
MRLGRPVAFNMLTVEKRERSSARRAVRRRRSGRPCARLVLRAPPMKLCRLGDRRQQSLRSRGAGLE